MDHAAFTVQFRAEERAALPRRELSWLLAGAFAHCAI
jgi:hypothetical protein